MSIVRLFLARLEIVWILAEGGAQRWLIESTGGVGGEHGLCSDPRGGRALGVTAKRRRRTVPRSLGQGWECGFLPSSLSGFLIVTRRTAVWYQRVFFFFSFLILCIF